MSTCSPAFHQKLNTYSCPILDLPAFNAVSKTKLLHVSYPVRMLELGRRAMKHCLLGMAWPLYSWAHSRYDCLHKTGPVHIQSWMRKKHVGPDPFLLNFFLRGMSKQASTKHSLCGVLSHHRPKNQDYRLWTEICETLSQSKLSSSYADHLRYLM